jgi:hypothetical protein
MKQDKKQLLIERILEQKLKGTPEKRGLAAGQTPATDCNVSCGYDTCDGKCSHHRDITSKDECKSNCLPDTDCQSICEGMG